MARSMGAPFKLQVLEQPDLLLGIEDMRVSDVRETYDALHCTVRVLVRDRPACRQCSDNRSPRMHGHVTYRVADTPLRGRKTVLEVEIPRYRHRCGATIDGHRPAFLHPVLPATRRLVRYVQAQTLRRPVLLIAREVGMSEAEVRTLALDLAAHLKARHRFPVPPVLGIDDLHIRKRIFTVVTNGVTGHAIALVDGGTFEDVRDELVKRRGMDLSQVRCIVSDMSGSNLKVVRKLFKGLPAVHVADKFHVLRYAQKALSRVISQELDKLRKPPKGTAPNVAAEMKRQAETIAAQKRKLMAARVGADRTAQRKLDLDEVGSVLVMNKRISAAFWSKIRLHQAYAMPTRATAIKAGLFFAKRARHPSIEPEFREALAYVRRHRHQILSYWTARLTNGDLIRPTTGPTERRNGSIRKIWRSAHGFRNLALLELRVLYEPWMLDVDIVMCGEPGCGAVEGPYPKRPRLHRAVQALADLRCSAHDPSLPPPGY